MAPSEAAARHALRIADQQTVLVAAGRQAWRRVETSYISESWASALQGFLPVVYAAQYQAAVEGAGYAAGVLAEQGVWIAPEVWVSPASLVGVAPDGRSLQGLLATPVVKAKSAIGRGVDPQRAVTGAFGSLKTILQGMVSDISRQAAGMDIVARPRTGYVRVASGSSCPRCTVLLGKFFRWNQGFLRHPQDDCVHVPTTQALAKDVMSDPYEAFKSLSREEQDKYWGAAAAQAIRDGADIYQVTNAITRGMTKSGMFTLEGTTRRGYAGQLLADGQRRPTPELIYRWAAGDRQSALDMLEQYGYLLPGGQVPGGSLRGMVEGFGQMGRGGTRVAASRAVADARTSGQRDPSSPYTMTAAERRLYNAERDYQMVLQGVNPWASQGFGSGGASAGSGAPLTPQIAAAVESNYRRWLASGGQVFTK